MKLLAFVRRCRRLSAAAPAEEPAAAVATVVEDAAAVVAPAETRRRRPSGSGSSGPAWKPTLGAISEDAAVVSTTAKPKPAAKTKPKAKAKATPRVVQSEYDDFRHFGAPTVLPAFAPTAFLF